MPDPVAAPDNANQATRLVPELAFARRKRLMAAKLARKHTQPARTTRRRSCSSVRQVNTRNMGHLILNCKRLYASNPLFPVKKLDFDDALINRLPSQNVNLSTSELSTNRHREHAWICVATCHQKDSSSDANVL